MAYPPADSANHRSIARDTPLARKQNRVSSIS